MVDLETPMAGEAHDRNGPDPVQCEEQEHEFNHVRELEDKKVAVFHTQFQEVYGQAVGLGLKFFPGDLAGFIRHGELLRTKVGIAVQAVADGQVVKESL